MASRKIRKGIKRAGEPIALRAAAERFMANPRTLAAIQRLGTDRKILAAAERNPAAFFSSRGAKVPPGLEVELFGHPGKVLPPPDWFPFIIEFYNCRTYYVRKCRINVSPPLCQWVQETVCFGIRVIPRYLPPIA